MGKICQYEHSNAMLFIDQINVTLGALSLKNIKNEDAFLLFSRSNSALFDLENGKIIDSRCSMSLSSLLQWFFLGIQYLRDNNGGFYLGKLVALVRIFETSYTKKYK